MRRVLLVVLLLTAALNLVSIVQTLPDLRHEVMVNRNWCILWLHVWVVRARVIPSRLCRVRVIVRKRHDEMGVFFSESKLLR